MSQPAVFCIGAGALQVPLLQEAKALGLYVIATDGNPDAPGKTVADVFAPIDTYDIRGTCGFALTNCTQAADFHLRGVVTAGADVAPTVAAVAQAIGVPGIPVSVAGVSHNKGLVRDTLLRANLQDYQPTWMHWIPGATQYAFDEAVQETIGYPCVVKPLEQRASRGVTIVYTREALAMALAKTAQYGDDCLVEGYHLGTEHSVEAIMDNETLLWFNVVDRYFTYNDGIPLEVGHVNPSKLSKLSRQRLKVMVRLVAKALGVTWGPFKIDVLWTDNGPKLLEATCRLSGGWDSQGTSPLTGRDPLCALLQVACTLPITPIPAAQGYAACAAILPEQEGILHRIPWHFECPLMAGTTRIAKIIWNVRTGAHLQAPAHCAERPGFVLTWGETYTEAWSSATAAAQSIAAKMEIV